MPIIKLIGGILFIVFISCNGNKMKKEIKLDLPVLNKYIPKPTPCIIVSCTRCICFDNIINGLKKKDLEYLESFPIIMDTNCGKLKLKTIQVKQNVIDSISGDIYNITLVKERKENYSTRIIKQEESLNLIRICHVFFGD